MKIKKWNKEGLLSGVGGGILGSILMAAIIIVVLKFDGQVITNVVTLIAGLGGGIISGLLTWLGVKYTIDEQRRIESEQKRKEHKDSIPQKILSMHKLKDSIKECQSNIVDLNIAVKILEASKELEEFQGRVQKFDKIRQELEPKLIAESLQINSEVYKATIQCVEKMKPYSYSAFIDSLAYSPSDIPEKTEEIVELISESYRLLIKQIYELDTTVSQALNEFEEEMFK
ncbi:hypothetical protein ACSLGG_02915 [Bacillus mycoides]|uniref:hypothetical protein n=1 Tax=Bacillus mycoides TaxID=1405 RepID=UPI003F7533C8